MGSNTKKAKRIQSRKSAPNRANLKANMKRIKKNAEILRDLAEKDQA